VSISPVSCTDGSRRQGVGTRRAGVELQTARNAPPISFWCAGFHARASTNAGHAPLAVANISILGAFLGDQSKCEGAPRRP
jgi:hypothetical protein